MKTHLDTISLEALSLVVGGNGPGRAEDGGPDKCGWEGIRAGLEARQRWSHLPGTGAEVAQRTIRDANEAACRLLEGRGMPAPSDRNAPD